MCLCSVQIGKRLIFGYLTFDAFSKYYRTKQIQLDNVSTRKSEFLAKVEKLHTYQINKYCFHSFLILCTFSFYLHIWLLSLECHRLIFLHSILGMLRDFVSWIVCMMFTCDGISYKKFSVNFVKHKTLIIFCMYTFTHFTKKSMLTPYLFHFSPSLFV